VPGPDPVAAPSPAVAVNTLPEGLNLQPPGGCPWGAADRPGSGSTWTSIPWWSRPVPAGASPTSTS